MQVLGHFLLAFVLMLIFQTILTDNIFASFNTTNSTNTSSNQLESSSGGIILENITSNMSSVTQLESVSGGLIESTSSTFNFKNFVTDGKIIFLNVLNIKPNTPIQYNSLACFQTNGIPKFGDGVTMSEIPCNNLLLFGITENVEVNSIISKGPILSSLLLNALDEGFDKPISACAFMNVGQNEASWLNNIDCRSLFIAYK